MPAQPEINDLAMIRDAINETSRVAVGDIARTDQLVDIGLVGLDLLACLAELEHRYGIEFPRGLVAALSTVDDLIHYTEIKRSQL